MARRGEQFERAVAEFARELMPEAVVQFDARVPDIDTGTLRQADAWISYRLGDHIPIQVLVSCKDHARVMDVGEVETFAAEMRSLGATHGVLYSRSGFGENAIKKAKALSISCCRFFENAPPEKPSELLLSAYAALPSFHLTVEPLGPDAPSHLLWRDVLPLRARVGESDESVAGIIEAASIGLFEYTDASGFEGSVQSCPQDARVRVMVRPLSGCPPFRVTILIVWSWHTATLDAFRLHGSFNVSAPDFKGKATLPFLPLDGIMGEGWQRSGPPPAQDHRTRLTLRGILWITQQCLRTELASRSVFAGGMWSFPDPTVLGLPRSLGGPLTQAQPQLGLTLKAEFGRPPR